jgi:hypothetical protein
LNGFHLDPRCDKEAGHAARWRQDCADGSERFVRYGWILVAGEHVLAKSELEQCGGEYLQEEIAERRAGVGAPDSGEPAITNSGSPV